jgi:hypothetical protein
VIVIVLVTVIATARIKPLLLLLPKVKARVRQKLKRIVPVSGYELEQGLRLMNLIDH